MNNLSCPQCGVSHIKKNGHTHYRKQNHRCQGCGRQFVADSQRITAGERQQIRKLLLERISLLGICRVMDVSLRWLLTFIAELYDQLPDDLNVAPPQKVAGCVKLLRLAAEADDNVEFRRAQNQQAMGQGSPLILTLNKSSLSTSATAAAKARANSGRRYPCSTASTPHSTATIAKRIRESSLWHGIESARKAQATPTSLSGSAVRCGSGCRAWCGRH